MKGRMRVVGWSVERPCVFHIANWRCATCDGECPCCGSSYWGPAITNYDLEVEGLYYPGAPAYTPRGEFAPVDPPEPPEFHIGRVCFAGTRVEFPWSLTEAEQEALEEAVLTDDEGEVERWDYE